MIQVFDTNILKGGWFVGDFEESVFRTSAVEVAYKTHEAGEFWDAHYHEHVDEINYLISGQMTINGIVLDAPVIFVIPKGEISRPEFITNVSLIVVKLPGIVGDKIIVD